MKPHALAALPMLAPTTAPPPVSPATERQIIDDRLVPFAAAMRRYTSLSRSTSERMAAKGQVKVVRFGRKLLVRESEIRRLVEGAVS